jgi:trans-aconitate methyltransferase
MTRDPKDFYETPDAATYPILAELIAAHGADHWERVFDLGCGDGRLGIGAVAAKRFANPLTDSAAFGIEADPDRAQQARDNGFEYVYTGFLEEADYSMTDPPPPDLVISNPPFSNALLFLETALQFHREAHSDVLFLLPVGYLGSQGRHAFWKANPPDAMRVFSKRLSFTGDGKTANADYAWFYWGGALQGIDFYP